MTMQVLLQMSVDGGKSWAKETMLTTVDAYTKAKLAVEKYRGKGICYRIVSIVLSGSIIYA